MKAKLFILLTLLCLPAKAQTNVINPFTRVYFLAPAKFTDGTTIPPGHMKDYEIVIATPEVDFNTGSTNWLGRRRFSGNNTSITNSFPVNLFVPTTLLPGPYKIWLRGFTFGNTASTWNGINVKYDKIPAPPGFILTLMQ